MKPTILTSKFTFQMGGIASKTGKPYLQVSNGKELVFITVPQQLNATNDTFSAYSAEDEIELKVSARLGSEGLVLLELPKKA